MSSNKSKRNLFDRAIIKQAVLDSFVKLNPRYLVKNPVMFMVAVGALLTTLFFAKNLIISGSYS